jgi:hypothetical protein
MLSGYPVKSTRVPDLIILEQPVGFGGHELPPLGIDRLTFPLPSAESEVRRRYAHPVNEDRIIRSTYDATLAVGALIIAFTIPGCAYPNQFRDVPQRQPHAHFSAEQSSSFFAGSLRITHINEQPTSFWRSRESFRIPPGSTFIRPVFSARDSYSYRPIRFTAVAGRHYILRRLPTPFGEFVTLDYHIPGGVGVTISKSPKDNSQ